MIYYFIFFGLCFFINKLTKHNKVVRTILIIALFAFLCFGYMTGSDWRAYEMDYMSKSFDRAAILGEVGFVHVSKFFSSFISDFWLYAGLMKCIYLLSLILLIRVFTKNVYATIAISFSNSLLFMLIDCPMRFMMALSIVFFGVYLFFRYDKKTVRILAILIVLMSIYMHKVSVVVVFLLSLGFLSTKATKVKPTAVFALFLIMLVLAGNSGVFDYLFASVVPILDADRFDSYTGAELSSIYTFGTLKYIIYLLIILFYKDVIINSSKYGHLVYFYTILFYILYPITARVPTLFRINIAYGIFADISLVCILYSHLKFHKYISFASKAVILLSVIYVLFQNCRDNYKITPYSNSIQYIISGEHLPYTYRDTYNELHHDDEFLY